jgi:hypothetical protein
MAEPVMADRGQADRAGIRAYMQFIAREPEFARMCIVEVLAPGPRAIARQNETMRMFAGNH